MCLCLCLQTKKHKSLPSILCCATKRQSVQINRTTLYLRYPSTLKAVIWCVATRGQTLLSQKISVQSDQWFLRYGQICVGKHTFSKSPKDAKNEWKICHFSETKCLNELKFRLELDFEHGMPQTKFQLDYLKST